LLQCNIFLRVHNLLPQFLSGRLTIDALNATMQAFYADHFVLPLPAGHRFPMAKYARLRERLRAELPAVQLQEALPATDGELALAHTPEYIVAVQHGTLSPAAQREIGFPWSPAMAERARRSVGATVQACRCALGGDGLAANLAGGTHHAYADKGSGFCVFNDAAVAARLMQAEHARQHRGRAVLPVAIVDLDVHQGNGTARIFAQDPSVFTLSLHGARNFPFRKEPSDLDVELHDGCDDAPYLEALEAALDELARRFQPELVIYLAGADPHQGDRLGRLQLSDDGLEARDRRVMDWAWQRRIPLAFAMAGGYGHDLETTVQVQVNTYRVALDYHRRWQSLHAPQAHATAGPQARAARWHNAAP
jgi:acetoin utilization deacetylase AcuC-like enzyme